MADKINKRKLLVSMTPLMENLKFTLVIIFFSSFSELMLLCINIGDRNFILVPYGFYILNIVLSLLTNLIEVPVILENGI